MDGSMSDRGSFVSEYVYCDKCFKSICDYFNNEYSEPIITVPGRNIIAGGLRDLGGNWAAIEFEHQIIEELSKIVCHSVKFALLPEDREVLTLTAIPK